MQAFKKVDMESWPRREHYRYYTEALKVEFNMTAPVDVQNLLREKLSLASFIAGFKLAQEIAKELEMVPHVKETS